MTDSTTEVFTNIYVTSFGPVSDTDMVSPLKAIVFFIYYIQHYKLSIVQTLLTIKMLQMYGRCVLECDQFKQDERTNVLPQLFHQGQN